MRTKHYVNLFFAFLFLGVAVYDAILPYGSWFLGLAEKGFPARYLLSTFCIFLFFYTVYVDSQNVKGIKSTRRDVVLYLMSGTVLVFVIFVFVAMLSWVGYS